MVHLVKRNDIFTAPDDILDFYLNAFYCGDCAGGVMVYGEGLPGGVRLIEAASASTTSPARSTSSRTS